MLRFLLDHLVDHQRQSIGNVRINLSNGFILALLFGNDQLQNGITLEGQLAGQEIIKRAA